MKPVLGLGCIDERIFQADVGGDAFAIYAYLLSHCNPCRTSCWPSIRRIADHLSYSPGKVTRGIKHLERAGMIKVLRRNKTNSTYTLNSFSSFHLCSKRAQIYGKSVSKTSTDDYSSVLKMEQELQSTRSLESNVTTKSINQGALIEADFWNWFAALPINGIPLHDASRIALSVKRHSDAKWLLDRAYNDTKWFKAGQLVIEEYYRLPWHQSGKPEVRKTSVRALVSDWTSQVAFGTAAVEELRKFRVLDSPF